MKRDTWTFYVCVSFLYLLSQASLSQAQTQAKPFWQKQATTAGKLLRSLGRRARRSKRRKVFQAFKSMRSPALVQWLLHEALNRRNKSYFRGHAFLALGHLGATWTTPILRKYRYSRSRYLRYRSRAALRRLCPRRLRRPLWFYLNLDSIKVKGPHPGYVKQAIALQLQKALAPAHRITTLWKKCGRPSRRSIRRQRMQGFQLKLQVKVTQQGSTTQFDAKSLWTTFPGNTIKQWGNLNYSLSIAPSLYAYQVIVPKLVKELTEEIHQFLTKNSRRPYKYVPQPLASTKRNIRKLRRRRRRRRSRRRRSRRRRTRRRRRRRTRRRRRRRTRRRRRRRRSRRRRSRRRRRGRRYKRRRKTRRYRRSKRRKRKKR